MKLLIMSETLGNNKLQLYAENLSKDYILSYVSMMYNKSHDSIRLSRFDWDFKEFVTLHTDADFKSLNDLEKLKLTIIGQENSEQIKVEAELQMHHGYVNEKEAAQSDTDTEVPMPQDCIPTTPASLPQEITIEPSSDVGMDTSDSDSVEISPNINNR